MNWSRLAQVVRLLLTALAIGCTAALPALAGVCETERPGWTPGAPATAVQEALYLLQMPATLILLLLSALAIRLRSQWIGLAAMVLWTLLVSVLAFGWGPQSRAAIRQAAAAEGCIGSPALFIGLVAAICLGMILYTTPQQRHDTPQE